MAEILTDEQLQRLRALLEHEGLTAFLPYAEQAAAEARISAARRLVWQSYRQMIIATAALIVALITLWDKARDALRAAIVWAGGP